MGNTAIPYATKVCNPFEGCAPCSPGCDRCYARKWANRAQFNPAFHSGPDMADGMAHIVTNPYRAIAAWDGTLAEFPARWSEPLKWRKPQRVFVGSRSDIALWPKWALDRLWTTMARCPDFHRWLLLTKRPNLLPPNLVAMPNVWLGVTVCNQPEADRNIRDLLRIPAAGYWISYEPGLGPVAIPPYCLGPARVCSAGCDYREPVRVKPSQTHCPECGAAAGWHPGIGWVVCGGESGKGARPMEPAWPRKLRDDCHAAGVPFWFKQWGDAPGQASKRMFWDTVKGVGRETPSLDQVVWNQLPAALRLPGETP